MQIGTALMKCRYKRYAEAAAPVARQIGETRSFVVLIRRQIGISHHAHRYKEKRIAETLNRASEGVVKIIRLQSKAAVVPHRTGNDGITEDDQMLWIHFARLHQ